MLIFWLHYKLKKKKQLVWLQTEQECMFLKMCAAINLVCQGIKREQEKILV